jgi:hypothetical protein
MERTLSGGVVLSCCALAACGQDHFDPCVELGGPPPSHPVGCVEGADPTVLAELSVPSSERNEEVAFSERHVALDEQYAYWSDYSGRILRTPKAGGATDVLLEWSSCSIADLAVDDAGVYFGENCRDPDLEGRTSFPVEGTAAWLSKDDGTRHDLSAKLLSDVRHVAVSDGEVYWVVSDEVGSSELKKTHRDGSVPPGLASTLVGVESASLVFAVGKDDVAWFDAPNKVILRIPKEGGLAAVVTPAVDMESMSAVGGDIHLVQRAFVDENTTEHLLWRVPLAGGRGKRPFDGAVTEFIATDGTGYYGAGFITPDGAVTYRVYRWLPPEYEPEEIAAAIERPKGFALDATHLFVVDESLDDPFTLRLVRIAR